VSVLPSYPLRALHLVAIWAYAVSQPVFALLQGNPEFLVVRGATRVEVAVFAVLLTFVPPLVALACEWLMARVSTRGADLLHLAFLGAFLVPLGMLILRKFGVDSAAIVLVSAALAAAVVAAYVRWRGVRLLFTFSVSLAFVGLLMFVARAPLVTDDVDGAEVTVPEQVPVVFLLLDEFPATSLMTSDGVIDAVRFPNFARFASDASWYPNATTVHESTTAAVPALLTGRLPRGHGLPTLGDHPENLFTLLGESYRFRVAESITHLCPKRYCPRERAQFAPRLRGLFADVQVAFLHQILPTSLKSGLPSLDDRWGGFSKELILAAGGSDELFRVARAHPLSPPDEFGRFLDGISRREPASTLHFLHVLLPHSPWQFFPSGRSYGASPVPVGLAPGLFWSDESWLVRQAYQRHLLQVGYTDRLLGELLAKLERSGIYDEALVVVVADQGVHFIAGEKSRSVSRDSIADIAPVPLLIKYPGQRAGRVDSRAVRTIDVLPTIADVLGVRLPWSVDGRSLLDTWKGPSTVSVAKIDGTLVEASFDEMEDGRRATLRRKAVFGRTWDSLLQLGLPPALRGLNVEASTRAAPGSEVRFDNEALFATVATASPFVPARVTGTLEGIRVSPEQLLVVAVNGRVVAATHGFRIQGKQRFSALLPETAFKDGFNRVELLAVEGSPSAPRLTRLGENRPGFDALRSPTEETPSG